MSEHGGAWHELVFAIRERLDMSQEGLAHRLDVSVASITNWESGRVRPCKNNRRRLLMFAGKLGIEVPDVEIPRLNEPGVRVTARET